jgi:circadian clock protein KaiB
MTDYVFRLFIAGQTPRSEQAIANLSRIVEYDLKGKGRVQIIDVLEQPDLAEADHIVATPTLIKEMPPPERRIIGDLSDTALVRLGLGIILHVDETTREDA